MDSIERPGLNHPRRRTERQKSSERTNWNDCSLLLPVVQLSPWAGTQDILWNSWIYRLICGAATVSTGTTDMAPVAASSESTFLIFDLVQCIMDLVTRVLPPSTHSGLACRSCWQRFIRPGAKGMGDSSSECFVLHRPALGFPADVVVESVPGHMGTVTPNPNHGYQE